MFKYFGGVPNILVPDNLKSAVSKACNFDSDINPDYLAMARHYNTVIIPARVG
jgi:transposase